MERGGQQNRSEGREAGRWRREVLEWSKSDAPGVPARLRKGQKPATATWWWAEASVWTERMVSALDNGVKGGKWFSLMDKVDPAGDPGSGVAECRAEQGGGRGGWPEHRAVRSCRRSGICESSSAVWRTAATGRSRSSGWRSPKATAGRAAGDPGGQGPHCADGAEAGHRADPPGPPAGRPEDMLRGAVPTGQLRLPAGRGCKSCHRRCAAGSRRLLKEGFTYVVDADLKSYFDSIPHERLMARVEERSAMGTCCRCSRLAPAGHPEGHGAVDADGGRRKGR